MTVQAPAVANPNDTGPCSSGLSPTSNTRTSVRSSAKRLIDLYRPSLPGTLVLLSYIFVLLLLYAGWQSRSERPLTPESGLGYALGIIGGSMMLVLLLYPLRKRLRFMRQLGAVRHWFRVHMLFGVLGPVCILFHSGFHLGSLNSNVALSCMLLVAISGLIGRYFYSKLHHGLYGNRATLQELKSDASRIKEALAPRLQFAPRILDRLESFEHHIAAPPPSIASGTKRCFTIALNTWWTYFSLRRALSAGLRHGTTLDLRARRRLRRYLIWYIGAHLASVRKVAEFHLYERLFALWHILHFPLFLILIVSGFVHVFAVHMY